MDVNGKGYQRNQKFLRATSELPKTNFENTPEETLETMKCDIENKAVCRRVTMQRTHSLIKDVQQEQKVTDTKDSKLESKSSAMKAKSEVPKKRTSEGDGRMGNENGRLHTRRRVIKKPNQYDDCVI